MARRGITIAVENDSEFTTLNPDANVNYIYVISGGLTIVYGDEIVEEFEYDSVAGAYVQSRNRLQVPARFIGVNWSEGASTVLTTDDEVFIQKPISHLRFTAVGTNTQIFLGQYEV